MLLGQLCWQLSIDCKGVHQFAVYIFKLPPVVVTKCPHLKCSKYHCALDGSMWALQGKQKNINKKKSDGSLNSCLNRAIYIDIPSSEKHLYIYTFKYGKPCYDDVTLSVLFSISQSFSDGAEIVSLTELEPLLVCPKPLFWSSAVDSASGSCCGAVATIKQWKTHSIYENVSSCGYLHMQAKDRRLAETVQSYHERKCVNATSWWCFYMLLPDWVQDFMCSGQCACWQG